jgi:hypothetical protein
VFVDPNAAPATFTVSSSGIGDGFSIPVVDLNFLGGAVTNSGVVARHRAFYRVVVPPNTPSWKLDLQNDTGESLLEVQQNFLPGVAASIAVHPSFPPGRLMHKPGDEHWVIWPLEQSNTNTIPSGTYYIAVASEGVNPNGAQIGFGSSSFILRSTGLVPIDSLGTIGGSDVTRSNQVAAGGEYLAYQFQIPPNTPAVEVRLDDRVGLPLMILQQGADFANRCIDCFFGIPDYGVDGGKFSGRLEHPTVITLPNPAPGIYSLEVKATSMNDGAVAGGNYFIPFPEAGYTLRVTPAQIPTLNFSSSLNTNGFSHTVSSPLFNRQSP